MRFQRGCVGLDLASRKLLLAVERSGETPLPNIVSPQLCAHVTERLAPDGALRNVIVLDTSLHDWQVFLDFVHSAHVSAKFQRGGVDAPMPSLAQTFFEGRYEATRTLGISIAGMLFNCHFFKLERIELDIDPREVRGVESVTALLHFMKSLGGMLTKDVLLADEGFPSGLFPNWEDVICSYTVDSDLLRLGAVPRPIRTSFEEIAAAQAVDEWTSAFWDHLVALVRRSKAGIHIVKDGPFHTVGDTRIMCLHSDEATFVVFAAPEQGRADNLAVSAPIDVSGCAPLEAAESVATALQRLIARQGTL